MIVLRINLKALFRPSCWAFGHIWKDYLVVHPGWNREGRFCRVCGKQQFVSYSREFTDDGETVTVRTDWNGTERYKYVTSGNGSKRDPLRMEKVSVPQQTDEQEK